MMQIQEKRKILQKIDKMPEGDLSELYEFIQSLENDKSEIKPHLASEKVLGKDWNKKAEEKAWQDL